MRLYLFFILMTCLSPAFGQNADPGKKLVYELNIMEDITKGTWLQVHEAFNQADSLRADVILIHMNTYGGAVKDADSIRTKILTSKIPVYVFIDNNAASAGALISMACDSIYMRPGSSFGAATVVNETGAAMPDKYQSYMRSIMRSTAEAHGKDTIVTGKDTIYKWRRNPLIAEAMVDQRIYVKGVSDTGKVLTFTPTEAMQHGFCEGIAENVPEVLKKAGIKDYKIVEYKQTTIEKIIGFLVHPIVSGILIIAIIGGLYFELQSPGIGFPLGVAVLAAILYFAPLYLEGLAEHWEILVFIIGVILIALEIFVIPGFGVTGIMGILFVFSGLVLSLLDNVNFDFRGVDSSRIAIALMTVLLSMLSGFALIIYLSNKVFSSASGLFKNLSLKAVQDVHEGFVSIETSLLALKGKKGVAKTILRPAGKVVIENETYDAAAETGYIDEGDPVVVTRVESMQLYVRKPEV